MEDNEIIELYWERSEAAISETSKSILGTAVTFRSTFYRIMKIQRNV